MAQSFNTISVSLGEAEREKNGKSWTARDYEKHSKHYNIDAQKSYLNEVLISAKYKSEKDLVNDLFVDRMEELNAKKEQKIKDWNDNHVGQTNPKTGKEYRKKSVDKREMYPIGKYAKNGKRSMPYDTFMANIRKGNLRNKNEDKRMRTSVLEQHVVGLGNKEEWKNDIVRATLKEDLNSGDPKKVQGAKNILEEGYFKPFLKQYMEENPSRIVVQGAIHYDEGNVHMQFTDMPYVDNGKNGGLGSTALTDAIIHDHPEMKNRNTTISQWYQQQHNELREIIKQGPAGMTLDDKRPGSHASRRVTEFNDLEPKIKAQTAKLDDLNAEIGDKQNNLNDVNDQLKTAQTALKATQQAERDHKAKMSMYQQQEQEAKEKADKKFNSRYLNDLTEFELNKKEVAKTKKQQDKREKDLTEREKSLKPREQKVQRQEQQVKKRQSNFDNLIYAGLRAQYPNGFKRDGKGENVNSKQDFADLVRGKTSVIRKGQPMSGYELFRFNEKTLADRIDKPAVKKQVHQMQQNITKQYDKQVKNDDLELG